VGARERYGRAMAEPLVGRAEQMAALTELERRVEADGRPGAVLVIGPPGRGPSVGI
jgi:hypothetical protein